MSDPEGNTDPLEDALLQPPDQPLQNFNGEVYDPMRLVFVDKQHASKLHTNLWNMREKGNLCDIVIRLGNCRIPAHQCILNATSEWFSHAGSYRTRNDTEETLIDLDNIQGIQMLDLMNVVRYLYIGELEVNRVNYQAILALCTKLKLGFAIAYIQSYINKLANKNNRTIQHMDNSSEVKLEIKEEDIKQEIEDVEYDSMDTSMEQSYVESDNTEHLDSDSLPSDNIEPESGFATKYQETHGNFSVSFSPTMSSVTVSTSHYYNQPPTPPAQDGIESHDIDKDETQSNDTAVQYPQALSNTVVQPSTIATQPVFVTIQPNMATQPPKLTIQPPTITFQPFSMATQPPRMTIQPLNIPAQPPNTVAQPPKVTIQPLTSAFQPPSMAIQNPKLAIQPLNMAIQPPNMSAQPSKMTIQPPNMAIQPSNKSAQPSKVTVQPPNKAKQLRKIAMKPPNLVIQSPNTIIISPCANTEKISPPKINHVQLDQDPLKIFKLNAAMKRKAEELLNQSPKRKGDKVSQVMDCFVPILPLSSNAQPHNSFRSTTHSQSLKASAQENVIHKGSTNMVENVKSASSEHPVQTNDKALGKGSVAPKNGDIKTSNTSRNKYACKKCDEVLQNGTYLRYHMLMEHSTKWVGACHHCEYITCHKEDMATHLFSLHKNITSEYPLMQCQVGGCNYKNVNPRCIKRHRDNHRDSAFAEAEKKGQNKDLVSEEIHFPNLTPVKELDSEYELLQPEYTKRLFYSDPNKNKRPDKKRKLPCHRCDKDFDQLRMLRFHVMEVHEGKWVGRCEKCDFMHNDKKKLAAHSFDKHRKVFAGSFVMSCKVEGCHYVTVDQMSLAEHMIDEHDLPAESDEGEELSTNESTHGEKREPAQFKCGRCDAKFHSRHLLKCHLYEGHEKQGTIVTCDYCDEFRSYGRHGRSDLAAHMNEKHKDIKNSLKQVACEVKECTYTGKSMEHMKAHMRWKHNLPEGKSHACRYCPQIFPTVKQLTKHQVNKHSVSHDLSCEYPGCREKFENRYYRLKHQNEVHKKLPPKATVKRYLCSFCEFRCNGIKDLIEHEAKKHESPVPEGYDIYRCDHCNYWTLRANFIEKHVAAHAGVKKHFCAVCAKGFTSSSNLADHIRIHKEKTFVCPEPECKGAFHHKFSLKNHMAKVHRAPEGQPLQECHFKSCYYRSYSKPALEAHIKKHSSETEENSEDSTSDSVDNQLVQQDEGDDENAFSFVISNTQSLQGYNEMNSKWGADNTEIEYNDIQGSKSEIEPLRNHSANGPNCIDLKTETLEYGSVYGHSEFDSMNNSGAAEEQWVNID